MPPARIVNLAGRRTPVSAVARAGGGAAGCGRPAPSGARRPGGGARARARSRARGGTRARVAVAPCAAAAPAEPGRGSTSCSMLEPPHPAASQRDDHGQHRRAASDRRRAYPAHPRRSPSAARGRRPRRTAAGPAPAPRRPARARRAGSAHSRPAPRVQRRTSPAGSTASSPTSSGRPPRSLASTGTPAASASSAAYGHGSSQRDGTSTAPAPAAARPAPAARRCPRSAPRRPRPAPRSRGSSGPLAGDHQRHPGRARRRDRRVESLLLHQPPADQRVGARSPPRCARQTRPPARSWAAPRVRAAGSPSSISRRGGGLADGDERVGVGEQARLLALQADRVGGRLGERAAAAQPQPGQRVAPAAAKARRAVAVADRDRAEQAEVVQVDDGAGARRPGRGQRPPAEQRMQVVGVDHVGAQPPDRGGHGLRVGRRRATSARAAPSSAQLGARALQQLHVVPARAQQRLEVGDRALLAPFARGSGCAAAGRA